MHRVTCVRWPCPRALERSARFPRIDYEDAFRAETPSAQDLTGEQWARVALEDAPAKVRRGLQSGWAALGLQRGSTEDERLVFGWEVRRSTPDLALLGAKSRLGLVGEVLVRRERRALLIATFIQLDTPAARLAWAGIAPGHRQVVPYILEQAVARHDASGSPDSVSRARP